MPKKSMENLTESMLYVLMAFHCRPMCGIEVAAFLDTLTKGRVQMGPATLYTILGKFEKEHYLQEIHVEGRKRTYRITERGELAYAQELERLRTCLADAQRLPPPAIPQPESPVTDPTPTPTLPLPQSTSPPPAPPAPPGFF